MNFIYLINAAATQQIEVVASHMNDYIRQLENSKKMLALQKKFTGSFIPAIIAPGRQFVKEGRLMKVRERILALFLLLLLALHLCINDLWFIPFCTTSYINSASYIIIINYDLWYIPFCTT